MWLAVQHKDKKALEFFAKEIAPAGTGMGMYLLPRTCILIMKFLCTLGQMFQPGTSLWFSLLQEKVMSYIYSSSPDAEWCRLIKSIEYKRVGMFHEKCIVL